MSIPNTCQSVDSRMRLERWWPMKPLTPRMRIFFMVLYALYGGLPDCGFAGFHATPDFTEHDHQHEGHIADHALAGQSPGDQDGGKRDGDQAAGANARTLVYARRHRQAAQFRMAMDVAALQQRHGTQQDHVRRVDDLRGQG